MTEPMAVPADGIRRRPLGPGGGRIHELRRIFCGCPDRRSAHERSVEVLRDLAGDPAVLTAALEALIRRPRSLSTGHYPVISLPIVSNPYFDLVFNCWLPLPDGSTDVSTKAIHHHGSMLLTTVTAFGSGYEHWTFGCPEMVDPERELFRTSLIERGQHPLQHVAFVDARVAHVPMYVPTPTVTLALWSGSRSGGLRDRVKRIPVLQRRSSELRRVLTRAGMAGVLALKNVEYFDFFPTDEGFRGMRERKEFPRGPSVDFAQSLIAITQATGNDRLIAVIEEEADRQPLDSPVEVRELIHRAKNAEPISPRLSPGHYGVPYANFDGQHIERALDSYRAPH